MKIFIVALLLAIGYAQTACKETVSRLYERVLCRVVWFHETDFELHTTECENGVSPEVIEHRLKLSEEYRNCAKCQREVPCSTGSRVITSAQLYDDHDCTVMDGGNFVVGNEVEIPMGGVCTVDLFGMPSSYLARIGGPLQVMVYEDSTCENSIDSTLFYQGECVHLRTLGKWAIVSWENPDFFTMSGTCDVKGDCVSSSNYPGHYDPNEDCTIEMLKPAQVRAGSTFFIEERGDHLVMNGIDVERREDVLSQMDAGDIIRWTSDFNWQARGWQLCFSDPPTKAPSFAPTVEPTLAPTVAPTSSCTLKGGEIVSSAWSGPDTGSNSCNTCTCSEGGLICTEMECGCTLKGGEIVPLGWTGSDTGSNSCNTCTCSEGTLACTTATCHFSNLSKKEEDSGSQSLSILYLASTLMGFLFV